MDRRRRRSPTEARKEAIDGARTLLLEQGPAAITLQAVARRMGVAHGNVTHHFGSASRLQADLAEVMIRDLINGVEQALISLRAGKTGLRQVVDFVFDAFESGGAGRLVAWLASSGHRELLIPLCRDLAVLTGAIEGRSHNRDSRPGEVGIVIAAVITPALGAALIGNELSDALSLGHGVHRELATAQLHHLSVRRKNGQRD